MREQAWQLTRGHIVGFMGDPEFYQQCPVFLFLRAPAMAAADQLKHARLAGLRPSTQIVANGLAGQLGAHLVLQQQNNPATLRSFVQYLSGRLGFWPRPVWMYYRLSGQQQERLELDYPQPVE